MKNKMNKNVSKGRVGRRLLSVLLALNLFINAFAGIVFFTYEGGIAEAAEGEKIQILIDEKAYSEANPYTMKSSQINLKIDDASAKKYKDTDYTVTWKIMGSSSNPDDDGYIELYEKARSYCTVKAKGYNSIGSTVQVVVEKTTGEAVYVTSEVKIYVAFGIDTWGSNQSGEDFFVINGDRALALDIDKTKKLKLNLGGTAKWTCVDTDVVTVDPDQGIVTPVGVGTTTITATGDGEGQKDTITVYVSPGITTSSTDATAGTYYKTLPTEQETIKSGDYLYVNANYKYKPTKRIDEKIYWEILDNSMPQKTIASSDNPAPQNGPIQVDYPYGPIDNRMRITGVSGTYYLYMYTIGTKSSFTGQTPYKIANAQIVIASSIEDGKKEILGVGDKYNLPMAFNLDKATFMELFDDPKIWQDTQLNVTNPDPLAYDKPCTDYAYDPTRDNDFTITTKREGNIVAVMHVKNTEAKTKISDLTGIDYTKVPDYFITHIAITDRISLSSETMTLMVGQTTTLHVTNNTGTSGDIEWTSSNPSLVSVEDTKSVNNTIKAVGVTTQPGVTITASLYVGNGTYRRASCLVTVVEAITSFTLNPSNLTLNVGKSEYVFAQIPKGENMDTVPLMWQSSDDTVIDIETKDGNKSALITGKKGGKVTLMVTNTLDWSVQRVEVEVLVPVTEISFLQDEYAFPFYQMGKNMKQYLKILPSNATSTDLEWSVDNTKIAKIDEEGYLTFLSPGSVLVKAKVKKDYTGIPPATTIVKIVGGPEDITFDGLVNNTLNVEVSQEKIVNLKYTPETSTTSLVWKASRPGIVRLAYDDERRQLTVLGQGVGECIVSCRTEDNLVFEFTVIVTQGAESISFSPDSIELILGAENKDTYQLTPILTPKDSTDTVSYVSRNTSVATVSPASGLVKAVAVGTTQIVATTPKGRTAIVDVTVSQAVMDLTQDFETGTVYVGESITITPGFVPETSTNKTINWTWRTLDSGGEVSIEGTSSVTVTGVKTGTVSVVGKSADNKAAMVSYVLSVKTRKPVYKTVVTLSPKVKYLNVGKSYKVKSKVTGAYKGNKKLKWKSSNKKVATVSQKGKVKAKKVGKATITATAQDGSKKKGKMKVIVRRLVTKIKMNKSTANILVGGTVKLSVKVTPSNATIKGVTWKSSDKAIATVSGGKVIGQAPGICKITATSKDYKKKKTYCWVTVRERVSVTNFTVADANITVAKGKSVQSGITPNPVNATDSIKYYSDNKAVATVTSKGKIKTHKVGQATIYARASNGVEAYVDVLVVDLNRKAVTLRQYDTEQLQVDNISKGVTWYSLDPNIAKVSNTGLVTARTPGTTRIFAKVDGIRLGCLVKVKKIK